MLFKIYSPGAEFYIIRFISGYNQYFVIFYFINYSVENIAPFCVEIGAGLIEHDYFPVIYECVNKAEPLPHPG